ncbi:E3 ubiquitin-protein ligase UHRF1 isoform X2 [Harpegnathos saltator]|uniref:E3 ubiquitin-protein ligase UHRF1 isoform X2 n=1 Tax=Harpegnathos saltator TaxID=610380 RepID=UPI00059004EE|nr:E3 ubiquitin-protein ligase UHRF1 isoform X2 [Harpegnathos saltator]
MYIKVRTIDGKGEAIIMISKLTEVEDLKREIKKELNIETDLQRLFFRGKQLENGYKLYDYNVNLNDVIQLMVRLECRNDVENKATSSNNYSVNNSDLNKSIEDKEVEDIELIEAESLYYKIGDAVDCLDQIHGAWFEAIIKKIFKQGTKLIYNVQWEFESHGIPFNVPEISIRPRARYLIPFDDLFVGQKVMINYNVDEPKETGLWYDLTISKLEKKRKLEELTGVLHIGSDNELADRKVNPRGEIYAIESPKLLTERSTEDEKFMVSSGKRRRIAATCTSCMDNPRRKCRECGCKVCASKEEEHNLLLCDECDSAYHLGCLVPPLTKIPEEDYWYCPECKNDENEIVKAGDKLKTSKKKLVAQDKEDKPQRDWGKGMACVGRTKECSLVRPNHRGPIPGVEVGTCWMFRVQVSESGVHRPHIAGIHGRETDCAYSLVLSGGYEDDIDNGDDFIYTGSGGRDLSGNKRTAGQSCDQTLTRMNKALAINCNAKLNATEGATAQNWKKGIPVRVVRNFKLAKYSKYAPREGNRYDGIYKVVRYYPDTGKSGFRVWKYVLRRDDSAPAPWTEEGKNRIASLGLKLLYPDGYLEAMKKTSSNKKRPALDDLEDIATSKQDKSRLKKLKQESYKIENKLINFIKEDLANTKLWDECCAVTSDGKSIFLNYVMDRFTCTCCLELVCNPVTTPCAHNICLSCLKRSFSSGTHSCPSCRHKLDKNYKMEINQPLSNALLLLYPGYNSGR